jgi:hypothetical protein
MPPPRREDGGPYFLEKVAKQYASKGQKAFTFGEFESMKNTSQKKTITNN